MINSTVVGPGSPRYIMHRRCPCQRSVDPCRTMSSSSAGWRHHRRTRADQCRRKKLSRSTPTHSIEEFLASRTEDGRTAGLATSAARVHPPRSRISIACSSTASHENWNWKSNLPKTAMKTLPSYLQTKFSCIGTFRSRHANFHRTNSDPPHCGC